MLLPSRILPIAGLLGAAACASSPSEPASATSNIRMEAEIGRTILATGDTTSIVFRLQNLTGDTLRLGFASGCQINPYIRDRRSGEVVYPKTGGWICTLALTQMTLVPHELRVIPVLVRGHRSGAGSDIDAPLPVGHYEAYADIESAEAKIQSNLVTFTVR